MGRLVTESEVLNRTPVHALDSPEGTFKTAMLVVVHGTEFFGAAIATLYDAARAELGLVDSLLPRGEVVNAASKGALYDSFWTLSSAMLLVVAVAKMKHPTTETAFNLPQRALLGDVPVERAVKDLVAALAAATTARIGALDRSVISYLGGIKDAGAAPEWARHVEHGAKGEVFLEVFVAQGNDPAFKGAAPYEPHRAILLAVALHVLDLNTSPTTLDARLTTERTLLVEVGIDVHRDQRLDSTPVRALHRPEWTYRSVVCCVLCLEAFQPTSLGAENVRLLEASVDHGADHLSVGAVEGLVFLPDGVGKGPL